MTRLGGLWLVCVLVFTTSARAEQLRFRFDVPSGYAATTSGGAHTLVSADAEVQLGVLGVEAKTASDVEAVLAALPREPSGDEMYVTGAARKEGKSTWRLTTRGGGQASGFEGEIVVRLFPGKGAVLLTGYTLRGAKGAPIPTVLSRLAKSLRVGRGAPGGEAVRPKRGPRLEKASLGPWQVAWTKAWRHERQAHERQVVLTREAPELVVLAAYLPGVTEQDVADIARRPFALADDTLAPVGEPDVKEGTVINGWASETMALTGYTQCREDGCLCLYAGGAVEHRALHQNAIRWFLAHAKHDAPRSASAPVVDDGARRQPPVTQKRRAPSRKNKLVRKVAGKRLYYSLTTGYGDDGVFVGGSSAREYHFCSDGSVYAASSDELVATGYESSGAGARQGVWSTTSFMGRDALAVAWSDGGEETLVRYDPLANVEAVLEQASREERRKIEAILRHAEIPNQVTLLRVGEGAPWVFQSEPSALCDE